MFTSQLASHVINSVYEAVLVAMYSLSADGLLAAAAAASYRSQEQQEQREADAQNQTQNEVQFLRTHLLSLCHGTSTSHHKQKQHEGAW